MKFHPLASALIVAFAASTSFAQVTTAETVQRDVNQETRIEQGLKNGSLNVKEAGRLEREESRVDRLQARDLRDGKLSRAERVQLRQAQDRVSQDIHAAKTNDVKGNPLSASNERMQADVQRNINQEQRIEQGIKSGELNDHQVGSLERGQARVDRSEARAAADGHVGKGETMAIQRKENHQSHRIWNKKHEG
jgi:hypothetical protein